MDYQLTSTSSRGNFDVTDHLKTVVATVDYESWFSSTATASVDGRQVVIKARNIWWSNFDLLVEGIDRGDITFNWKGQIIIKLMTEAGTQQTFLLKLKGFWEQQFVLLNEQETVVMELRPLFKWQQMHYNYEIRFIQNDFSPFDRALLLTSCGYAANLYMSMMTAAATA